MEEDFTMHILRAIKKVPGGLMVVPLLLGVLINTAFPHALSIGGFTTALFKSSATALIALFCLCTGSQINIKEAGKPLYKGILLTLVKFLIGAVIGWVVGKIGGPAGVLGITPLAIVPAITNSNGGMYAALASQYGDSTDVGAISILSLNDGPFFTMLVFGIGGLANIPLSAFAATLIPIFLGFLLGNLDEEMRDFLGHGTTVLIPFFAFSIGAGLSFKQLIQGGIPGLTIGIFSTALTGTAGYFVIRALGERKSCGAAIGTTAGSAVATPAIVAAADATLKPFATIATAQVATSVIVTAILCPLLVNFLHKKLQKKYGATPDGAVVQADGQK